MTHLPIRTIGLTGGIACGKSTVSDYLRSRHHCTILDADIYARDAVTPPSAILNRIQSRYGTMILTPTGELNRAQLGQIIFEDLAEREWLERQIHPYVRQRLVQGRDRYRASASATGRSPLVMVIPLLFESRMEDLVTEIWVVACSVAQQQERLMMRNTLSLAQANARIESQWPLSEKVKRASIVIDNSGDRAHTYAQIDSALQI